MYYTELYCLFDILTLVLGIYKQKQIKNKFSMYFVWN
jgi:hypothetical protein